MIKMNFLDIFKKDFIIGLDIGTSSVNLAQFERREAGLYLTKLAVKAIKGTDNDPDFDKKITEAIKDLFTSVDKSKSHIVVSINSPYTAIRRVFVPYMPKQELRGSIALGVKNYFPFPVNNSLVDSEISDEITDKGVKKYEIIVAVSPRETVDKYLSLLQKAEISPVSFVPVPLALQKLAETTYAKDGKTACFIDIGRLHTELVIMKGKKLMFSRKIPLAGEDFTKAMTGVLVSERGRTELNLDEAENIKKEIGIPEESDSRIINDKISSGQVLSMLRTPLTQLVNEIERSFDYYREESGGGQIEFVGLFGAGSSLSGLPKFLSTELGIEVKLGNPLEGLKLSAGAVAEKDKILPHSMAVAIGSALSEAEGINLLPAELKEQKKRLFKRTTLETTITVIILVLAFVYTGIRIKLNNYQKRANVGRLELVSLEPQIRQARVFSLMSDEPYWADTLKELSNIIPSDIYITSLSMKNKTITIKGIVPSLQGQARILNFVVALQKGIFNNVKLVSSDEIPGKTAKEFVITCWVD